MIQLNPVDLDGNPVRRKKHTHPYNYDGFVLWRGGPNKLIDHCVYTDRIFQWDWDKAERLVKKHMPGKRWSNAGHEAIEAFLRAYQDDPGLQLIVVMEWCNQATGYPVWSLHYKTGVKNEPRNRNRILRLLAHASADMQALDR